MIKIKDKSLCTGCGACVQSCSLHCISMQKDEEGFYYPKVEEKVCIDCGNCESVCPCINSTPHSKEETDVWCVKHQNDRIRFNSSSGGAFSALAEYIIQQKGIVFGAAMSADNCSAEHIAVQSFEEIERIRGSKYLQSSLGNTYVLTKEYLEQGRRVLFSGTPCQIKGLKLYLKKDFAHLICVDVICHGVPSQSLWAKYVEYLEKKLNAKIGSVNFRSKKYGWRDFGTGYFVNQEKQYFKFNFEDPYFCMFNSNFCLRPSCYYCQSKDGESGADITLGDFWNVETVFPELSDNKGLSMVLLNSDRGRELFEAVKKNFWSTNKGLSNELARKCNPAIYKSQSYHIARNTFYKDMNKLPFEKLSKKYVPKTGKVLLKAMLLHAGLWTYIEKIHRGVTPSYGILIIYKK